MNRKTVSLILTGLMSVSLFGCAREAAAVTVTMDPAPAAPEAPALLAVSAEAVQMDGSALFSNRDLDPSVDLGAAVAIDLNTAKDTVIIEKEGVYILSGSFTGQVLVDTDKSSKVQLVLNGAEITSPDSAAIFIKKADKVFVTLADNTENRLANGGSYLAEEDSKVDAVLYSRADLTLNGSGSLTVEASAGHGIVSKDELVITGGTYTINAAEHGMTGKDSIAIAGGSFAITAGEDGIHAKNDDDASLGFVYIRSGDFEIQAGNDGISATGTLLIEDGSFLLTIGGGSEAAAMRPSDGQRGPAQNTVVYGSAESAKGLKSQLALTVNGGSFTMDCADDAVHAGGDICITGGDWKIRTADDGIHSDAVLSVSGGDFDIPYCYEGLEGQAVTIDGGSISIVSADDGINAAGGMDSSGFGSRDRFADSSSAILVNGGSISVVSEGDCLDSNGSLILNGGTLKLTCGGNGNTALDCDGTFANNGADISTNDGSENGGGFGGRGGFPGAGDMRKPQQGAFPDGWQASVSRPEDFEDGRKGERKEPPTGNFPDGWKQGFSRQDGQPAH